MLQKLVLYIEAARVMSQVDSHKEALLNGLRVRSQEVKRVRLSQIERLLI